MILATLAYLAVATATPVDDVPTSLLGRSFSWDPQGLVSFSATEKFSAAEKGWIELMREGEYGRASAAASSACTKNHPTYFAVWVVAESARARKDISGLTSLASALEQVDSASPFARYAAFRLASLELAQTPATQPYGNGVTQNPAYPPLLKKTHEAWLACREAGEKSIPVAAALATGREAPADMRAVVLKALATTKDDKPLLLWKARALMLGRWSFMTNLKTKSPERDAQGRVAYFFEKGDEPDMKGAEEALNAFHAKFPADPKYHYYHARWLSWNAAFFTEKDVDRKATTQLAVSEMQKFLEAKDQPLPLVESGAKFLKRPDPGAFNTPPIE